MSSQVEQLNQASRIDLFLEMNDVAGIGVGKYEAKVARYERLGVRMFNVANCLVSFGNLVQRFDRSEQSMVVLESTFCDALGFADEIRVVNDLRKDPDFSTHPLVVDEPHIQFYAMHPIFDESQQLAGCIYLIDYQARDFDDESRLLFADLAMMIERELLMGKMKQRESDLLKQIRNLRRDALLDPVLGMWNRSAITRALGLELERCDKSEKSLSILFVAMTQLEVVRQQYGATLADMLLLKIVSRMRSCIRPFDALGRFQDDVFLVVLPGASNLVAAAVAERIRLAVISSINKIGDDAIETTLCVGIASTNVFPDVTPEVFVAHAEKALLAARRNGIKQIVQASAE